MTRQRRQSNETQANRKHDARQWLINLSFAHPPTRRAGDQYEARKQERTRNEGAGRCRMIMGDMFNRLVLRLMDEQVSKTRRLVIVPCVSFLVSCLFVSSGVSSLSIEPGEIDTAFYRLSGRVKYVSLLVRKWKTPSSNCTLHTPSITEYSNCST